MSEPTVDEVIVKILRDEIDDLRRKVAIAERALLLARSVCYHPGTSFDREKVFNICDDALDAMKGGA